MSKHVVPVKKRRGISLRYRVAGFFLFGGMSLFLFGVVFVLVRRVTADQFGTGPAWAWALVVACIALTAAAGVFFALVAWGAVSDQKSRLGAWIQQSPLADAVHHFLFESAMLVILVFGCWYLGIKWF
jgi:membrane-bound ClpP family serine protease